MNLASGLLSLLAIGFAGGIIYTLVTHPDGVKAITGGLDNLVKTAGALELGQVA